MERKTIPLPVVIMKENEWFVASCPPLGIATQGKTEEEVKENMGDLIDDYLEDPDTPKPEITSMETVSLTIMQKNLPQESINGKTQTIKTARSN